MIVCGISLDIEQRQNQQLEIGSDMEKLDLLIDLHQKQLEFFNAEHPKEKTDTRNCRESYMMFFINWKTKDFPLLEGSR